MELGNRVTSVWECHPPMILNGRSAESLKVPDSIRSYTSTQRSFYPGSPHLH